MLSIFHKITMKKQLLIAIICFICCNNFVQAQTITTGQTTGTICKGLSILIPFTFTGTFETGNVFKVQIRNNNQNVWTDLVTEGNTSPLKFTIPTNFEENNSYYSYYIRVVASKPNVISTLTNIGSLSAKPKLILSGLSKSFANPYEQVDLKIRGTGTNTIKAVLNDSTVINISSISSNYDNSYPVYASKTHDYTIAYASNECGRGEVSGSAKLTVNEIGVKPILSYGESICIGGSFKISYSADGKFDASSTFRMGLKQINADTKEYEFEATEKDGIVSAIIPNYISTGVSYQVRIVSSSPKAISPWTTNSITIGETPSIEIVSPSTSISWGKEVDLKINYTGIGPYNVKLNDGTYIYSESLYPSSPTNQSYFTAKVKPLKTQSYSIASSTSGCGVVGSTGKNIMNVTVKPGMVIDSLKSGLEVCLGESFSAKYSSSGNVGNIYAVLSVNNYFSNYDNIKIPAVFENGIMKVTIPKDLYDNKYISSDSYFLGIIYSDGNEIVYSNSQIRVRALPKVSFNNTNPIGITTKGYANLPVTIYGSNPVTVTFNDSTTYNLNYGSFYNTTSGSLSVQPIKTTTYTIKSYSNICGTVNSNDTKSISVNVKFPVDNDIIIKTIPYKFCTGEKAKVYFNTIGTFKAENEFKVEILYQYNNSTVVVGTGKTSPIEITIPDAYYNTSNVYVRVVSSAPTAGSDYIFPISINTKPQANLTFNTDFSKGILPNESISFGINLIKGNSGANIYTLSDGTTFRDYDYQAMTKKITSNTTFSLKSVSNECGVGTVSNDIYKINVVPFKINPTLYFYDIYRNSLCANSLISYNYKITGIPETGTTFNLQIASVKDSVFKDIIAKTTENPIKIKLPSDLTEGNYLLRLVSNTTSQQISTSANISVYTPITGKLTAFDGTNAVSIDGGYSVTLKYDIKGSTTAYTFISDDNNAIYRGNLYVGSNTYSQEFYPKKTTTYTLKSIENTCGYGTVSGSVKILIKPSIALQNISTYSICAGKKIAVNLLTYGEFETDNVFKFTLIDSKKNRYDIGQSAVLSDNLNLDIPANLAPAIYQLEINSTKPAITKMLATGLSVISLVDVSLSGNTIINPTQEAYISIISNLKTDNGYDNTATYTLSNDYKSNLSSNGKTIVYVKPVQTTTFTLKSVENACGIGKSSGSATVTVNPITEKTITTTSFFSIYSGLNICAGGIQYLYFDTKGSFSVTNKFIAQISDKNGDNFKDIVSEGDKSPLKATIPDDLVEGNNYRIRVVASDKDVSSAANLIPLTVLKSPTATLDSTSYFFTEGKPVNVKINLTGTSPWALKFGTEELSAKSYMGIITSPYVLKLNPISPIAYKIFSVNDAYCVGKVNGTGIVRLELITANEELSDFEVKLFPNPTSDKITVQSDNFKNATLQIFDNLGRQILQQNIIKSETVLDISNFKTGQYLLQIERDNKRSVYKIHKL